MPPRIAVVHPHISCAGGSESRALWTVQALQDEFDVTLISMGELNIDELNHYYGTNLSTNYLKLIEIPFPRLIGRHLSAIRGYPLSRYCRKNAPKYDVMISAYNFMDFGRIGIQFLGDFSFDDNIRNLLHPTIKKNFRFASIRKVLKCPYTILAERLHGDTWERMIGNLTIANSVWSQQLLKERFGIQAKVIYPPVSEIVNNIAWEKREDGFVMIGRISPEKRHALVIQSIRKLRKKGYDIHLHLVGDVNDKVNKKYINDLRCLVGEDESFIHFEGRLSGKMKQLLINRHKYGVSACKNEAFGIAIVEMIKGGCIVFVPNSGGQVEIIDNPLLLFQDADIDQKILNTITSDKDQKSLRKHLLDQSKKFSSQIFMNEVKSLIKEIFFSSISK